MTTMFGFEGRGHGAVMVGRVPVVPGRREAVEHERILPAPNCAACGYGDRNGVLRRAAVVDGIRMTVCVDGTACAARYRRGTSPASYAAGLRGEILGVTP